MVGMTSKLLSFSFCLSHIGDLHYTGIRGTKTNQEHRRRIQELSNTLSTTFTPHLLTTLTSNSTILLSLHILSLDGSLLSALINASTLALIDAGIPMPSYICACTAGSTSSYSSNDEKADPLLDLNLGEEQELPFLTVATAGEGDGDGVVALVMETRVQAGRLEGMLAVGVDGCKQVREILDGVIRSRGKKMLGGAMA
ncbi:hypothetical protein OCU04_004941 [Sclerotinia nivalis]|uniref:Exoribonuclease phosphorolytic domain-containing protein n=1 Tax=Sclerotinia nivalis TaxID=352851 RepID=A0A9X0DJG2_9HELO|nr:hypothetical protein OCU04_004941 [Sclerotinia nivalis]